jgi:hypothetical protein
MVAPVAVCSSQHRGNGKWLLGLLAFDRLPLEEAVADRLRLRDIGPEPVRANAHVADLNAVSCGIPATISSRLSLRQVRRPTCGTGGPYEPPVRSRIRAADMINSRADRGNTRIGPHCSTFLARRLHQRRHPLPPLRRGAHILCDRRLLYERRPRGLRAHGRLRREHHPPRELRLAPGHQSKCTRCQGQQQQLSR